MSVLDSFACYYLKFRRQMAHFDTHHLRKILFLLPINEFVESKVS